MATIPTINNSVGSKLEDIENLANQLVGLARMCRSHACMTTTTNQNNKNSGYIKNVNLIIDVALKISNGVNLYRVERGVEDIGIGMTSIGPSSINTLSKQLAEMSGNALAVRTKSQDLHADAINAGDSSAVKLAGVINEIMDQIIYLIAMMDEQQNTAGTNVAIQVFAELIADNTGIRGLDQLPHWE